MLNSLLAKTLFLATLQSLNIIMLAYKTLNCVVIATGIKYLSVPFNARFLHKVQNFLLHAGYSNFSNMSFINNALYNHTFTA